MGYVFSPNLQKLSPCGCWYIVQGLHGYAAREYMPQIDLAAHTTIMSLTSKTVLKQTFVNFSTTQAIDQARYTFPLYDGVSVVGFECQVGSRIIRGLVKEKEQARADYNEAVSRGETAGLLEQLPESSDVFTTRIGNIPAQEKVVVEITYLGELKHDAEVDGVRFTIPTAIAPRYGNLSNSQAGLPADSILAKDKGVIEITVDITVDEASFIKGIQSPSHPIGVSLGRTSVMAEDSTDPRRASATLSLGSAHLEKDFVLLVLAKDQDIPRALLETHPNLPNQRALMATLVPRFNLPPSRPEIVFVIDRSGSMGGKITTVISALKVFLKSLPVGVKFNICSFGSQFSFLWPRSKSYDKSSLEEALAHVSTFGADFGGTEMFQPVVQTVNQRYKDMQLEVVLLTDGEIWDQQSLFDFINETVSKEPVRFFSLGIGNSVSHSLVEGIARAGNGFAQFVGRDEKLDKKVVRMLKGALTPHIKDYTLEVKYEESIEDGYEMVEKVTEGLRVLVTDPNREKGEMQQKPTISLFDPSIKNEDEKQTSWKQTGQDRYSHLPTIAPPKLLQAPSQIPPLYPFIRTSAYLLMSSEACQNAPKSVVLRATSEHGPLELEIPVQDIGKGETIHRLAAKKAMTELEEGRGWIVEAKGDDDKMLKERFDGRWDEIVQREAVRLGVDLQVAGKWCSFVAVQQNTPGVEEEGADLMPSAQTLSGGETPTFGERPLQPLATVARRGISPPEYQFDMQQLTGLRGRGQGSALRFGGSVSPGSSQSLAENDLFGAFGSASQVPDAGFNFGGLQSQTRNTFFGASGNSSRGTASVRVNFGGLQSQAENTPFGTFGSASQVPGPRGGPSCVYFEGPQPQAKNTSSGAFGSASQLPQAECFNFGGPQPQAQNSSFGAFGSASQLPQAECFNFGGPQPETRNSFFEASGNASQVPAFDSGNFGSQSGGLQPLTVDSFSRSVYMGGVAPTSQVPAAGSVLFGSHGRPGSPMIGSYGRDKPMWKTNTKDLLSKFQRLETPVDRMHSLIALQGFDGSWDWSDELLDVVGLTKEDVTSLNGEGATVATVLAVAFFERKVPGEKETWELVVDKARDWLETRAMDVEVEVERVAALWP